MLALPPFVHATYRQHKMTAGKEAQDTQDAVEPYSTQYSHKPRASATAPTTVQHKRSWPDGMGKLLPEGEVDMDGTERGRSVETRHESAYHGCG